MEQDVLAGLRERLERYPAARYPVQHATAQLHLGAALLQAGDVAAAVGALEVAVATYDPVALPEERARAGNLLGAALREAGRSAEAIPLFRAAAEAFAATGKPLEEAAARHNLALVSRDQGDLARAAEGFAAALERFEAAGAVAQSAAAARELGAVLLERGELEPALEALATAVARADAAADLPALAAAENVRGLAELAAGRPDAAAEAFTRSAGACARTVRPETHAMAKANLALALERSGAAPHARLAARQALGSPVVPPPVAAQAGAVLDRLGDPPDDLPRVLEQEPGQRWTAVLREELAWWPDADEPTRRRLAGALARHLAGRRDEGLCAAWVDVLLELPPPALEAVVRSTFAALAERPADEVDGLRRLVSRTLPRFPLPQWLRLRGYLDAAATDAGLAAGWG